MNWLNTSSNVLFVHYDDLQTNTYEELVKMTQFLNLTSDTERLSCAVQEFPAYGATGVRLGDEAYGNKRRVYQTENPYTPEMRKLIDSYVQQVNESLAAHHQRVIKNYNNYYW